MDEKLLRQLVRQLKILNFWIIFFGVLFLASLITMAILIFKMVTFVHSAEQKITAIQTKTQSSLNIQQQVCNNKSLSSFLPSNSNACK